MWLCVHLCNLISTCMLLLIVGVHVFLIHFSCTRRAHVFELAACVILSMSWRGVRHMVSTFTRLWCAKNSRRETNAKSIGLIKDSFLPPFSMSIPIRVFCACSLTTALSHRPFTVINRPPPALTSDLRTWNHIAYTNIHTCVRAHALSTIR